MGVYGDIKELMPVWRRAPWRVKTLLFVSGFLAISSLASLAETVANWKGFFLTGIRFYRNMFRDPFFSFVSNSPPLEYSKEGMLFNLEPLEILILDEKPYIKF